MALNFFKFLKPKNGKTTTQEVEICELLGETAQEYSIRNLCFNTCVNMIANALGRCEFRTYKNRQETFDREHYLWNVEPNINQNSSDFLHELVAKLYKDNEVLIISPRQRDGHDVFVIADSWEPPLHYPTRQNEYRGVTAGETIYDRTFRESDVIHLRLNNAHMRPVIDALYASYNRMIQAATKAYTWGHGQHWKVHVGQVPRGQDGWADTFAKMISDQVKPFLQNDNAVLPEFDGYDYQPMGEKSGSGTKENTRDIKALFDDIFEFTAQGFLIPLPLIRGNVADSKDSGDRFMSDCIDPICYQLQEEVNRKRYGFEQWQQGTYMRVDSSAAQHYDLFTAAASVEKLIGSGVYSINDVRRAANQEPINADWADRHFMTLNIGGVNATELGGQEGGNA